MPSRADSPNLVVNRDVPTMLRFLSKAILGRVSEDLLNVQPPTVAGDGRWKTKGRDATISFDEINLYKPDLRRLI
jgi:hypothetical protein